MNVKYNITDSNVDIPSFGYIKEIPYFLRENKRRLRNICDIIIVVSKGKLKYEPLFIQMNTFHSHRTSYAAIDSLAPALVYFFLQAEILPIIQPINNKYYEEFENTYPQTSKTFSERGILIPRNEWMEK